jgi:GNAT superfamily N-acetyltransferase
MVFPVNEPLDRTIIAQSFTHSRYERFAMAAREFTGERPWRVTEAHHEEHVAWVALDLCDVGQPIVGIAQFVRAYNNPTLAAVAVEVSASHRRRGLATLLLRMLVRSAEQNSVECFLTHVSPTTFPQ